MLKQVLQGIDCGKTPRKALNSLVQAAQEVKVVASAGHVETVVSRKVRPSRAEQWRDGI